MRHEFTDANGVQSQGRLLRTLSDELKLPLMQIARSAELARLSGDKKEMERTEVLTDTVLRLLDSYVLSTQTMLGQQTLQLEPISLSAVMYDTAQYLHRLAQLYECDINLSVTGKQGLVMAHPQALQAALTSLGYSFISSINHKSKKPAQIILLASRSQQGITAGVQTTNPELSNTVLSEAKDLYGYARQPLTKLTHNSGAGIMVASSLFEAMASPLKVVRRHGNSGLAATLLRSQQLALL